MKGEITSTEVIYFNKLSVKDQEQFSDKLYELTCKIFGGGDKEEFEEMVSKCNSESSRYLIFKNEANEWVGYIGLHRFKKPIDNKNVVVFRAQIGLVPEYRRKNASFVFAIKEILKYKIFHPFDEVYSFVAIINPSMYCITHKYVPTVYPSPDFEVSEHIKNIIDQCADHFGFPQKEGDTFWARTIGWYPINTEEEKQFWFNSKERGVRYYQELNPDFLMGKGLMTLIPFTLIGLLRSLSQFMGYTLKKRAKFRASK